MNGDDERLREHPKERFSERVRHLSIDHEYDELVDEPRGELDNHRQISLVNRHGLSLILFHFEEGGTLPPHDADGEVSIHVLDGQLDIRTSDGTKRVATGEVLILAPGVEHDAEAVRETKMLLTIGVDE
ncbi:MAG: cupin domain-containing protein [Bradymonadaceae bacterium]